MAFVHVKALDPVISKAPQHSNTTDSKDYFLTESVTLAQHCEGRDYVFRGFACLSSQGFLCLSSRQIIADG